MPVEPPTPLTEQLAAWQALPERIRQGDRSQVLAWDEAAAGRRPWSHLPGAGHPAGPPPAPPRTAPGRLGHWHPGGPPGGSQRSQHDRSPTPPWRCRLDDDLRRRWRAADLLGPASRAARGAARPDLGGMTDQSGRHTGLAAEGSTTRSSGPPSTASLPAACCLLWCGQTVDQLPRFAPDPRGLKPIQRPRCGRRRTEFADS
jgi:hypothetical protein